MNLIIEPTFMCQFPEMLKIKNMLYNMFGAIVTANDTANVCVKYF